MTKHKRLVRKQYMDIRLKITGKYYAILIVFMLIIVLYDSFKHTLPFYYILFGVAGYIVSYIISLNQKVILTNDNKSLSLSVNHFGKVITVLLLITRYFAGKIILKDYNIILKDCNVIWITDALYLTFMGIYFAKIKSIFWQIDEYLYAFFYKIMDDKNQ